MPFICTPTFKETQLTEASVGGAWGEEQSDEESLQNTPLQFNLTQTLQMYVMFLVYKHFWNEII